MCMPYFHLPALLLICVLLLPSSLALGFESLVGFNDLKFGMTETEVSALPPCNSSSECLYEIAGKNRYIIPFYQSKTNSTGDLAGSTQEHAPPTLVKITVDMGWYSEELYGNLHRVLAKKYQLTHDLTAHNERQFQMGETDELVTGFQDARVLLKIVRRKFGNLIITMVYQNDDQAAESRKAWAIPNTNP